MMMPRLVQEKSPLVTPLGLAQIRKRAITAIRSAPPRPMPRETASRVMVKASGCVRSNKTPLQQEEYTLHNSVEVRKDGVLINTSHPSALVCEF
jgi:hypothetical protein